MDVKRAAEFKWPYPWRSITDEHSVLAFGRRMSAEVAPTVLAELKREICHGHPLFGIECIPIAYDTGNPKEFLFLTAKPSIPVVLVHFTWKAEHDPRWPFVQVFDSIDDFVRRERKRRAKWWQFWL